MFLLETYKNIRDIQTPVATSHTKRRNKTENAHCLIDILLRIDVHTDVEYSTG
jgi:hypothetical protein